MTFNKQAQKVTAVTSGIVFLIILLVLAILVPKPTPFQYIVFRIVLALAAAAFAATIPGFLQVKVPGIVQATGAIAIFAIIYFFSPADMFNGQRIPPPKDPCEKVRDLLIEFDCDAFTTPLHLEDSLVGFNVRLSDVHKRFEESIEQIHVGYRSDIVKLFKMLKALEKITKGIKTTSGSSDYVPWFADGIAVDSLRYAIVSHVNDLLKACNHQQLIDNSRFITESPLLKGHRLEEIDQIGDDAKNKIKLSKIEPQIVDTYLQYLQKVKEMSALYGGPVRQPGTAHPVYIIEKGRKRAIPDQLTYLNLYKGDPATNVPEYAKLDEILPGKPLIPGTRLVWGPNPENSNSVYLIDSKEYREIASWEVFRNYGFLKELIKTISADVFSRLKQGPPLTAGPEDPVVGQ